MMKTLSKQFFTEVGDIYIKSNLTSKTNSFT